ncbi:hypothetical protein ABPG75_001919 [Micractinium tetrahymenae]
MAPLVPLRRVIRAVWILLSVATLSALPWMVFEFRKADYSVHYQAWFIAGIFVILAVSASIYEVAMHLEYYNRPKLQLRVVRILWMVPIYAVDSWLSLRFKEARFYIDPVRECYEAFVIYQFFMYLVAYLEDEYGDISAYFMVKEQVPHLWPVSKVIAPWPMGERFFWETKRGVLSYVIARPLMTAVSVVSNIAGRAGRGKGRWWGWSCGWGAVRWWGLLLRSAQSRGARRAARVPQGWSSAVRRVRLLPTLPRCGDPPRPAGVYGEGEFRRDRAYPYVALVNNCTQMWALYCLVLLYQATHDELRPIRPLSKFVVIKLVVFVTYWQSVFIAICARLGLIRPAEWSTYDTDDVAAGLQNFLICIEMFLAAVAHAHAFPPRDYMDASRPPPGFMKNLRVMFDVRDVVVDVNAVVSDTVQQTTDNLTEVGRRTWTTARETLVAAPEALVTKPLKKLFRQDAAGSSKGRRKGKDGSGSDSEEEGSQALLHYLGAGSNGGGAGGGGGGSGGSARGGTGKGSAKGSERHPFVSESP